ncbi:MAG: AAA family ATPase [Myxococcota bacterium]
MDAAEHVRVGDLWVDLAKGRVSDLAGEERHRLSSLECRLLEYLLERRGAFVGESELLVEVWGYHRSVRSRAPYFTFRRLVDKLCSASLAEALERHAEHGIRLVRAAEPVGSGSERGETTDLIGRTHVFGQTDDALDGGASVVLVGRGGVGKTRLAREIDSTWQGRGRAVAFVDLSSSRDLAAALRRLGRALRVDADLTLHGLPTALESLGGPLLILDNVEQLPDEDLLQLHEAVSTVRLLVTSQRRLPIAGLVCIEVPPLAPADAVALFVARARAARSDFEIEGRSAAALQQIAEALESLPLALELAAGRASLLSALEIQSQLQQRLSLLRSRRADRPARHETLRATVGWSLALLNAETSDAVAQLAAFSGAFTVAHAQALLGADVALQVLDELTDRFLLRRVGSQHGVSWFALWADVRLAALDLASDPRAAAARTVVLELAEERVQTTRRTGSLHAHAHVLGDVENLEWVHESGTPLESARAMRLLFHAYQEGGPLKPLVPRLLRARDGSPDLPDWLDVELEHCIGLAYGLVGELALARQFIERCIERALGLQMVLTALSATIALTRVRWRLGDSEGTQDAIDCICELSEAHGLQRTLAVGWNFRGTLLRHRGELPGALTAMRHSLDMFEASGDARSVALAHLGIGRVLLFSGDVDGAVSHLEMSHQQSASVSPRSQAEIEIALAQLALEQGRIQAAESFLDGARASQHVYGPHRHSGEVDGWTGLAAAARGEWAEADRHLKRAIDSSSWSSAADGPSQWWIARGLIARLDGRDPQPLFDRAAERPCSPDALAAAEISAHTPMEPVGPMSRLALRWFGDG